MNFYAVIYLRPNVPCWGSGYNVVQELWPTLSEAQARAKEVEGKDDVRNVSIVARLWDSRS